MKIRKYYKKIVKKITDWEVEEVYTRLGGYPVTINNITLLVIILFIFICVLMVIYNIKSL